MGARPASGDGGGDHRAHDRQPDVARLRWRAHLDESLRDEKAVDDAQRVGDEGVGSPPNSSDGRMRGFF